ncbi:MAG TPA: NADPH:quinone reductase [Burkholderiaceae bacterium]|nr:NADPH:quinone reductase [Burkholderiaceae bacterium]
MRAVWYERTGAAHDVLQFGEMDRPQPEAGEVLVRIAYSGVNPSDVKRRAGTRTQGYAPPRIVPNMDGSGVVVAVGEGVDRKRIGERVWLHSTAWKRPFGTAAEYATTPSQRAIPLPDGVPLKVGAALGVPALTAHRAVHGCGDVAGRTVLVTGGAGAVGLYAIQLAKRAGARVIATARGSEKLELVRQAGAEAAIDYTTEPVAQRIASICGTVDHVVDVDFAANLATTLAVLAPHGSIATYASMSDPEPRIPFYSMMTMNLRLLWVFVYELHADTIASAAFDVNAWLASGTAVHRFAQTYPLQRAADAHVAVEQAAFGKVVIEVAGENAGA